MAGKLPAIPDAPKDIPSGEIGDIPDAPRDIPDAPNGDMGAKSGCAGAGCPWKGDMTGLIMDAAIPVPVDPIGDPAIPAIDGPAICSPIGGYGRYIPKGEIGPGNGILGKIPNGDPIGKEE